MPALAKVLLQIWPPPALALTTAMHDTSADAAE